MAHVGSEETSREKRKETKQRILYNITNLVLRKYNVENYCSLGFSLGFAEGHTN